MVSRSNRKRFAVFLGARLGPVRRPLPGWAGPVWMTETGYRAHPAGDAHEENQQAIHVRRVLEEQLVEYSALALTTAVVGLIAVVALVGIYNGLVRLRNQVKEAWAQVDVQLKRRFDLIPNLMETVKGYMSHERETLEAVTQARAAVQGAEAGRADEAHPDRADRSGIGGSGLVLHQDGACGRYIRPGSVSSSPRPPASAR
mgnify:CR=1 FL=1